MIAHLPLAIVAIATGSAAVVVISVLVALHWRTQAHHSRIAMRLAQQREIVFVEAARRLADAARISIGAVRDEMERAVRTIAPTIETLLFFEEVDAELACVAAAGDRSTHYTGMRCALDDERSPLVAALQCGHRVVAGDHGSLRVLHPADRSAAAIPLVLESGRRCVLYVGSRADIEPVLDRIVSLIDQATPAYRIALERADDRARAEFDGLTGLLTARAFRTRLARLMDETRLRPLGRLALLFIDTDRFKQWNDNYGHASGDALLRELALLLRAAAGDPADLIARNGGDEFCIVFVDCEKSRAIERAERLRASISAADFSTLRPADTRTAIRISASIGVASYPVDADSPSALLERADEAMYHSKQTGRDAVAYFGVDGDVIRAESTDSLHRDPERRRG